MRSRQGRILPAMPMSVCQTSPFRALSTRGVGGFHFIEKREAFAGDMVADRNIIGVGLKAQDLKKQLAPLQMRELGNFFDDLSETHTRKPTRLPGRVQAEAFWP